MKTWVKPGSPIDPAIATDLQTGRGISPHQQWKNWPGRTAGLEVPGAPPVDAGLSFLQALLGFVLGCILVIAVLGLLEFRRVALAAQAHAEAAQFEVSELQGEVANLKLWNDTFQVEITQLQKAVGVSQAAEFKAKDKNVQNLTGAP